MAKQICLLSAEEGKLLASHGPGAICCNRHKHAPAKEAQAMKMGSEHRGWLVNHVATFKPMAKPAMLPDGSESKRHVIQTVEFFWRVTCPTTDATSRGNQPGARGISGWQLIPSRSMA